MIIAALGLLLCASARGVPIDQGEFYDLTQVRLSADPAFSAAAAVLASTFQILETPEDAPVWSGADHLALAPEAEGGARYQAACSGTFLGGGRVVTARHCLRSKHGEHFEGNHILRRHIFRVENDHLVRVGYEDFHLSGAVLQVLGDLEIVALTPEDSTRPVPAMATPPPGFGYPMFESFHALGYPSSAYGAPALAARCLIKPVPGASLTADEDDYLGVNCRLAGGMSGGPQFDAARGFQIGINSMSGAIPDTALVQSPRLGQAL